MKQTRLVFPITMVLLSLGWVSCMSGSDTATLATCPALTAGSSWTPSITGAGGAVTATTTNTTVSGNGPVVGFAQAVPAGSEISLSIDMTSDLGAYGSLTLSATSTNVSSAYAVYPMLVYLSDGTNDLINLTRAGGADCRGAGYYQVSGSNVIANPSCTVTWPSAYVDRDHWEMSWLTSGQPVVNSFPTCNWAGGANPPSSPYNSVSCPFNTTFFSGGKLRSGVNYTAKYVLLSGSQSSVSGVNGTVQVTVTKKAQTAVNGVMDVNVVLVGSANVNASRTAKGQLNLNTLFQDIFDRYNAVGIRLKTIRSFEWPCDSGGDAYSSIATSNLNSLFSAGGAVLPSSATANGALNLFLINTFSDSSSTLGQAGAINGPLASGTAVSGVAVATLARLGSYNPLCTGATCPLTSQESTFAQLGPTVSHEMGHYLGLYHPAEKNNSAAKLYDVVHDTPVCTPALNGSVTIGNCKSDTNAFEGAGSSCAAACPAYNVTTANFCPAVQECQFNHLMFRTSKNFVEGTGNGDGNMISPYSKAILQYHPLVQ